MQLTVVHGWAPSPAILGQGPSGSHIAAQTDTLPFAAVNGAPLAGHMNNEFSGALADLSPGP
jgi:hypothetical protein